MVAIYVVEMRCPDGHLIGMAIGLGPLDPDSLEQIAKEAALALHDSIREVSGKEPCCARCGKEPHSVHLRELSEAELAAGPTAEQKQAIHKQVQEKHLWQSRN
jgi:hypothetical protein